MTPEPKFDFFSLKAIFGYSIFIITGTVAIFFTSDPCNASKFGDTFGVAGALLSGIALCSLSFTSRQLNDGKKIQDEFLKYQQQQLAKLQEQVDALSTIAQAIIDPVVVVRVELSRNSLYSLVIENTGRTSAYNLQFDVEPKQGLYFSDYEDFNIADLPLIKNGLPMLAPSQKISTIIINGTDRENRKEKGVEFPDEMSVKVSYEIKRLYSDGRIQRLPHSFTYQFSFASQNKTFQHRGEIADEINLIYEFIKKNFKKE